MTNQKKATGITLPIHETTFHTCIQTFEQELHNVFKMADLHIKFFQNITNLKSTHIFSNIKGIFATINNFTCIYDK